MRRGSGSGSFGTGVTGAPWRCPWRPGFALTSSGRENPGALRRSARNSNGREARSGLRGAPAFSWLAEDLNATGVMGDPAGADAETGRILVDHYGAALAGVIEAVRAFPN